MVEKPAALISNSESMKNLLRVEELGMFLLGLLLFATLEYAWWIFPLLILAPDISMAGYLAGSKAGAFTYNLFHHKGVAVGVYMLGSWLQLPEVMLAGVILFSHASMDRIFGYGLKYTDAFKHTHLGWIGKDPAANMGESTTNR